MRQSSNTFRQTALPMRRRLRRTCRPRPSVTSTQRAAFESGDYVRVLASVDQAIGILPKDAALHEFRSLVLFALGSYRDAAAAIHAVLAVGPGWNWSTMSALDGDADDYTKQLRALERHTRDHPSSADAQFLLAYHYLTMGHEESAKVKLETVLSAAAGRFDRGGLAADAWWLGTLFGCRCSDSCDIGPKGDRSGLDRVGPLTDPAASILNGLQKNGAFNWAGPRQRSLEARSSRRIRRGRRSVGDGAGCRWGYARRCIPAQRREFLLSPGRRHRSSHRVSQQ